MTNRRPGEAIRDALKGMPENEHRPFLAYLEQKCRHNGDEEMYAAVRDYRIMLEGKPYLRLVDDGK